MKLSFVCAAQLMSSFLPSRIVCYKQQHWKGRSYVPQWGDESEFLSHTHLHLGEQTRGASLHGEIPQIYKWSSTVVNNVRKVIQMSWCSLCVYNQAFSRLISSGRLLEEHTDVSPYEVDDHVFSSRSISWFTQALLLDVQIWGIWRLE